MTTPADILNIAKQYNESARHSSILEPFKEGVLLLRAKDASYENITTILNDNRITVSVATIRKFCLRHSAEIKRLRNESQRKSSDSVTKLNDPSTTRPPLTSMIGKVEPRVARDNL